MKIKQRVAGGPYYVHFTGPGGKRMRLSTETNDETAAQLAALRIMREHLVDTMPDTLRAEHANLETLSTLLSEAWHRRWSKQKGTGPRKALVTKIAREIGHWPLAMVTYERVEDWLDSLTTGKHDPQPLSSATKNRHVSVIHTAFTEAAKRNRTITVPRLPSWPEDNVRERYLTPEEEGRVVAWFDAHVAPGDEGGQYLRHLFLVLLDTGMRCGEALGEMRAESILRLPKGGAAVHLTHGSTKSGKGRVVPLTARAEASARLMIASPLHGTWTSQQAGKRWRNVMEKVGISGVTLHTLRHTCASRLVQAGVDLYKVMTWLGHSSLVITQRYAHFAPDSLTSALDALEQATAASVDASDTGTAPGPADTAARHSRRAVGDAYPVQEAQPRDSGTRKADFLRVIK